MPTTPEFAATDSAGRSCGGLRRAAQTDWVGVSGRLNARVGPQAQSDAAGFTAEMSTSRRQELG